MKRLLCVLFVVAPHLSDDFNKCGSLSSDQGLFAINGASEDNIRAPWLAALGKYSSKHLGGFQVICSGTIITKRILVTAAHCWPNSELPPKPDMVRAGANRIDSRYAIDRKIKEYKFHPDYKEPKYYYEVALVILKEELRFTSRISSICLPRETLLHPGTNTHISVQGWGKEDGGTTGKLASEVSVGIRSKEECDDKFQNAGYHYSNRIKSYMPQYSEDMLFCANANLDPQSGTCHGDSGGPAIQK